MMQLDPDSYIYRLEGRSIRRSMSIRDQYVKLMEFGFMLMLEVIVRVQVQFEFTQQCDVLIFLDISVVFPSTVCLLIFYALPPTP